MTFTVVGTGAERPAQHDKRDAFAFIQQKAAEAAARTASKQEQEAAAPKQLPLWPEPTRGVPNGVLRSALFGAIKRGKRRYMERASIASLEGITILYTGP